MIFRVLWFLLRLATFTIQALAKIHKRRKDGLIIYTRDAYVALAVGITNKVFYSFHVVLEIHSLGRASTVASKFVDTVVAINSYMGKEIVLALRQGFWLNMTG